MSHHKNIEGFFHKSFEFVGNQNWVLPTEAYKTAPWQINTLLKMKIELNNVKNQLSSFDLERWSAHTKFRDPSSHIVSALKARASIELLTQAWCKFYECLNRYPVVPEIAVYKQELTSLHLCEAPGAFISALNRFLYTHHRKINWNWTANTLNPYYEGNPASDMIADDRLIRHTLAHWNFGADLTGDLMKYYNHEVLVEDRSVMLVTADGSVDCMKDPGEQENNVHYLHYCETITALKVLEKWGNFILKIFTIFEHGTICLLYLLNCCFVNVHIFKPCSSKSGNSEVYVICIGYKGWEVLEMLWPSLIGPYQGFVKTEDTAMFPLECINSEFLQQIEDCSNFFKQLQCHTINENVRHFIGQVENDDEVINSIKTNVAERFIKKYRLAFHIPKRHKLITNYEKHKTPIIEDAWDFKLVNVIELPFPNENNVIKAKIGRALVTVTNSEFCNINFNLCKLNSSNDNELLEEVLPLLSPHYRIIQGNLCENKPQYVYQRTLFYNFMDNLESNADVVLIRIPLLTRFLVGLVYILAQGFTTIAIFRKGVLILQNPIKERVHIVQTFFKAIESVYRHIDTETNFTADILEIISSKLFQNGSFDKIICTYNNKLFGE